MQSSPATLEKTTHVESLPQWLSHFGRLALSRKNSEMNLSNAQNESEFASKGVNTVKQCEKADRVNGRHAQVRFKRK
jgi:hypothetical protein